MKWEEAPVLEEPKAKWQEAPVLYDAVFDDEQKAKMDNAMLYSSIGNQDPSELYDIANQINTELYGQSDNQTAVQKNIQLIEKTKSWGQAIEHGLIVAGNQMNKSMKDAGWMVADIDQKFWNWVGVKQPEILKRWDEEAFELSRETNAYLEMFYKEHRDQLAETAPETGLKQKALWYAKNPKVVVQNAVQSAPIMLLGGLGKVAGLGKAGIITLFGGPSAAETYTQARAEGTEVTPALAQSILTGTGEGAIEEWTFGKKIGIAQNFSKIVKGGFPKITWEALKAYGRGTAEEGGQQANRNFWQFIFTDANQKISEGVADAAAAGGPVEMLMAGVFGMGGYTIQKTGELVDQAEQHRRLNIIEGEIQKSQNFTETQKAEISQEIDSVREDVDSGVYLPVEEKAETPAQTVEKPPSVPVAGQTVETGAVGQAGPGAEGKVQPAPAAEAQAERQAWDKESKVVANKLAEEIRQNEIYQAGFEGQQEQEAKYRSSFSHGTIFVPEKFRGEVKKAIEDHPALKFKITHDPKRGKHWDEILMEIGETDMTIDELLSNIAESQEGLKRKGKLNRAALDFMVSSRDPHAVILAAKYDMIQNGLTPEDINDNIRQIAAEWPNMPEDAIQSYFVETTNVETKPGMAKTISGKAQTPAREAREKRVQKDLLGRPILEGGASGKQGEFLSKEDYRLREPDIEGQQVIPMQAALAKGEGEKAVEPGAKPLEVEADLDKPELPSVTSARQAAIAEDRKALGLDEIASPDRKAWKESLSKAKEQGFDEKAMRIAAEVNSKPRPLSDEETAGVVLRAARLKNEYKGLMEKMSRTENQAEVASLGAEAERVEQEFETLSKAIHLSGTEKGRALAAQKLTINQDYDLVSVVSRAKAAKGKGLTESERAALAELTTKLDAATARIDALQEQVNEMAAQRALRQRKGGRITQMTLEQRDTQLTNLKGKIQNLLDNGCY